MIENSYAVPNIGDFLPAMLVMICHSAAVAGWDFGKFCFALAV